jgi:hypothetical protein
MERIKTIFHYWRGWIGVSNKINEGIEAEDLEGLIYIDGFIGSFWYILNQDWYKMNDKFQAKTIVPDVSGIGSIDGYVELEE